MIGLKRGTVKLYSHHNQWSKLFKEEKKLLSTVLNDTKIKIEHIGSTAIKGVSAKPIVDMVLTIPKRKWAKSIYQKLESIGYIDRGAQGVIGRRLFVKGSEASRTNYLHTARENSDLWKEVVLFRDYMRRHKNKRDEYNKLKKQLAKKFSNNRKLYTSAKSDFIQNIIKKAVEYYK